MANLRSGLELVAAGAYGNLRPSDRQYVAWTQGDATLSLSGWCNRLHAVVSEETQWLLKKGSWPDQLYSDLCRYLRLLRTFSAKDLSGRNVSGANDITLKEE